MGVSVKLRIGLGDCDFVLDVPSVNDRCVTELDSVSLATLDKLLLLVSLGK